jgi:hypothetical protein
VVSRSGGNGGWSADEPSPEGEDKSVSIRRSEPPGRGDGAEINVRLRVGYKTVLLVVVVFDLVHLSFRELFNSSWVEQLLGLSP